jgi:hypothetical protein
MRIVITELSRLSREAIVAYLRYIPEFVRRG